ncbi:hypothetical protein CLIM01_05439 [Colletotrichum limetticola]|uniref:Uncharacterized protein n=1 Tax=Colletotrichum limetticola TaxID=1209924 RepID=A0ABQ9Q066_9PEZI|nr:hypothetical protein CLIM01_05439 [Colletotrichum limetticola]
MSVERRYIQFIYVHEQDNSNVASAESQRRAHSHAATTAHARARRQRNLQYQAVRSTDVQVAADSTLIKSLRSARRDSFASFAKRFSSVEDFLLDYYVHNVVPCSNYEPTRSGFLDGCTGSLNHQFIQLAATSSSALNGPFLVISRHLSHCFPQQKPHYTQLALQDEVACARLLMDVISCLKMRSPISDSIITIAVFLAKDEILVGDVASTQQHLQGAIHMVRHNGALNNRGFNMSLYDIIQKDIVDSDLMKGLSH